MTATGLELASDEELELTRASLSAALRGEGDPLPFDRPTARDSLDAVVREGQRRAVRRMLASRSAA